MANEQKYRRAKAMWLLRAAADLLEEDGENLILPGWDPENETATEQSRTQGIRDAAKAVVAEGLTCDECTRVPHKKLGYLVRYIGDMLEE